MYDKIKLRVEFDEPTSKWVILGEPGYNTHVDEVVLWEGENQPTSDEIRMIHRAVEYGVQVTKFMVSTINLDGVVPKKG